MLLCACNVDTPPSATQAPTQSELPTQEETPARSGETFGMSYTPEYGFNPYTCAATTNRAMFSLLYESLFVVSNQFRAEPLLCESFTVSEDGKTYTYTLIPGVKFADGTPLTADDAAASIRAAKQSKLYAARLAHISSITAQSDLRLTILLDTPYENFSLMLDVPIVKADMVEDDMPIGTGAYALQGTLAAASLQRSKHWWQMKAPAVSLDTILLNASDTPGEIRDDFEFGTTDLVYGDPNSDAAVGYRCDYELWEAPTTVMEYIGFNLNSSIFSNIAVRRAVTRVIDRESLVKSVYGGFALATSLPCSPDSDLYDETLAESYAPESFQTAVRSARLSSSESSAVIFLVCADNPTRVSAAQQMAESFRANGLPVTVRALVREEYERALQNGNYDLYYGQVRLTANFDLTPFFDGTLSYGGIRSDTLLSLCTASLENSGNYYELCAKILNEAPICPVVFKSYSICVARGAVSAIVPGVDFLFRNASTARTLADADKTYENATEPVSEPVSETSP
jgi:peptide/nickel transport system substrate-binding protein